MWGLIVGGWLLAKSAVVAATLDDAAQAEQQLVLARFFYAEQLLPQAGSLFGAATAGSDDLFALDAKQLLGV